MKQDKKRLIMSSIYQKHGIKIVQWLEGTRCIVASIVSCSEFDFLDRLAEANNEIRRRLLCS